ncbi:MAG: cytochrome c-type biogenesis protein CcmH, partial [Myxococcales bacterium]
MTLAGIALLGLLAAGDPTPMGRPAGTPLAGSQLDARTEEVAGLLRCPVCQGLSVADSPATMARNMKLEVRDKLAAGYDQEQILADFER